MTTRKMSYTKSCKIIEMCVRLKFQKLIPEGKAKLWDIRTIIVNYQSMLHLFHFSLEAICTVGIAERCMASSWSRHSQTRLLFRDQDKTKSFIQGSRGRPRLLHSRLESRARPLSNKLESRARLLSNELELTRDPRLWSRGHKSGDLVPIGPRSLGQNLYRRSKKSRLSLRRIGFFC